MPAGYVKKQSRTIPASGSYPFVFSLADEPYSSIQVMKSAGTMDVSFTLWASNVDDTDVMGDGVGTAGTVTGGSGLSGSAYDGYWAPVAAGTDLLSGSVSSDPAASAMVHLTGCLGVRSVKLVVSSGWGGTVTLYPHRKA